jgi:hypothetical protein
MPGHSRSKNGVASLAYVPGIHVLAEKQKVVDGRNEPGHAELNYSAASAAPSTIRTRSAMMRFSSKSFGV